MSKKNKYRKRRIWFKSPVLIILILFLCFFGICYYLFGLKESLITIAKYGLGATGVALLIAIFGYIFKKPIVKLIKGAMK